MRATAHVNYHIQTGTSQAFHFEVDGIPGNLESPPLVSTQVSVEDLRHSKQSVSYVTDGVEFTTHRSAIGDFESDALWQSTYDEEVSSLLKRRLGAREIIVFDHTLRVDDDNAVRKPARNVHTDYSEAGARQRLIDLLGAEKAADYEAGHYAFINIWRAVGAPIETSPLGFIRPSSVAAEDWMIIDLIYPGRRGEILGIAANTSHDWFYLSQMTPDEVAIFNIYDNQGRPQVGHSAFDMTEAVQTNAVRKSLETRTLVRF
ncbi:MAG: CmcJ/NvfI family oxidoreductase [Pseudomonadota bacterium]